MTDDGQMILLSAFIACLCLVSVVACMSAVNYAPGAENRYLSADTLDNILWAQDTALSEAALHQVSNSPESRYQLALSFKEYANPSMDSLSHCLLKRGVSYLIEYNDSRASGFISSHKGNDMASLGGVIIESHRGIERVYGCAYDVIVEDRSASYHMSRVVTFY